jgi:hypothetical protein
MNSYQQTSLRKSRGDGFSPSLINPTQNKILVWGKANIQIILLNNLS